jgi:hypothetical protein
MSFPRIDHSLIYRAFCIARLRKIEDYVRAHLAESISIEMLAEFSPKWETDIHLNRLFRSAQAFTVEPRPVEAADAPLPGS